MNQFKMSARSASLASLLASVSSAVALFVIFRVGVLDVSASAVGCWSLVQGLFVVTRVADSGAGANVTRFVASRLKVSGHASLISASLSAWMLGSVPVTVLGLLIVWPIVAFVSHRYSSVFATHDILVLGVTCLIFATLSSAATIVLSVAEGTGRLTAKSLVIVISNVLGVVVAGPLISSRGLVGVGLTYVAIGGAQLVAGICLVGVLTRKIEGGHESTRAVSRLLWRENAQLSAVGLLRLSLEPTTKLLLSLVAPLPLIAAFELALRVATQLRVLIQAGVQPLLALGSRDGLAMDAPMIERFDKAANLVSKVAMLSMVAQLIVTPLVSWGGLGRVDPNFVVFFGLLVVSNGINAMGITGYYFQLSSGSLGPLVRIQVVMSVLNVGLGALLAFTVGPLGAVVGYALAFAYGGIGSAHLYAKFLGVGVAGTLLDKVGRIDWLCLVTSSAIGLSSYSLARWWGDAPLVVACTAVAGAYVLGQVVVIRRRELPSVSSSMSLTGERLRSPGGAGD